MLHDQFNEGGLIHQSERKPQLPKLHKSVQQALGQLDAPSSNLPDHQLHSMMAFVITEQTTPVSADVSVTSSPPVNEHFLHPHPEDPSHFPQSQFPQPGHNLGANVEIRNHGTANLQPQASLEPQPVFQMPHQNHDQGSVVNRPLFDPTTVDLNTEPDPHANHPVFQAVPNEHFLDQAPPPHPQVSRSLGQSLHHKFSVLSHDKAPMMAALPGTTIQCNAPDSSGSYTCDSFIHPDQTVAARVTFPQFASGHKRPKRKPKEYERKVAKDEVNIDFDTVLNPKSTQLLKTIFQKNKEKQGSSGRERSFPSEAVDLTPDANEQVLVKTAYQKPKKENEISNEVHQPPLKKDFFKTPEILPSFTKSSNLTITDPPLVPALAGTTVECNLPDNHGSYSCTSFQNKLVPQTTTTKPIIEKLQEVKKPVLEQKFDTEKDAPMHKLKHTLKSNESKNLPSKYKSTKSILEEIWKKAEEERELKAKKAVVVKDIERKKLQSSDVIDDSSGEFVKTTADTSNKETKNTSPQPPSVEQNINFDVRGNRQNDNEQPDVNSIVPNDTKIEANRSKNTEIPRSQTNDNQKPLQQLRKELKENKINKIMKDAVKRAIKYNRIQPTTSKPHKPTAPSFKLYDPVFNPVTGKPLGLVNKNTGVFYPVGHETFNQQYDVKRSTMRPKIVSTTTIKPVLKAEGIPLQNFEQSSESPDHEEGRSSFSTIDSLTKEFNSLISSDN